jgi:hypothetical protein
MRILVQSKAVNQAGGDRGFAAPRLSPALSSAGREIPRPGVTGSSYPRTPAGTAAGWPLPGGISRTCLNPRSGKGVGPALMEALSAAT